MKNPKHTSKAVKALPRIGMTLAKQKAPTCAGYVYLNYSSVQLSLKGCFLTETVLILHSKVSQTKGFKKIFVHYRERSLGSSAKQASRKCPFDKSLIHETKQSAMHQQLFLVPFLC